MVWRCRKRKRKKRSTNERFNYNKSFRGLIFKKKTPAIETLFDTQNSILNFSKITHTFPLFPVVSVLYLNLTNLRPMERAPVKDMLRGHSMTQKDHRSINEAGAGALLPPTNPTCSECTAAAFAFCNDDRRSRFST